MAAVRGRAMELLLRSFHAKAWPIGNLCVQRKFISLSDPSLLSRMSFCLLFPHRSGFKLRNWRKRGDSPSAADVWSGDHRRTSTLMKGLEGWRRGHGGCQKQSPTRTPAARPCRSHSRKAGYHAREGAAAPRIARAQHTLGSQRREGQSKSDLWPTANRVEDDHCATPEESKPQGRLPKRRSASGACAQRVKRTISLALSREDRARRRPRATLMELEPQGRLPGSGIAWGSRIAR
jgi:hypothetical protein